MAFWKSDDDKKREMEEVKRQVEGGRTGLPEPPEPPVPEEPSGREGSDEQRTEESMEMEEPSLRVEEDERYEEGPPVTRDVTREPPRQDSGEDFAPLFVKIDKYRQILQDLERIRGSLDDLKNLFELMGKVDETKRKGMDSLRDEIAGLADTLVSMDEKFIRPEGTGEIVSEPETGVSKTVKDLKNDLRNIRDSLDRLG